jgi:hypothetical protein
MTVTKPVFKKIMLYLQIFQIIPIRNFIKIRQTVQPLILGDMGGDRQRDGPTWFLSDAFHFCFINNTDKVIFLNMSLIDVHW